MARISDIVEAIIKQMIEDNDGLVEITRSALADQVNCVPSQITYVLSTRFTNSQGYLVESRRGGGGMIRIRRVELATPSVYLMHTLNNIGSQLSQLESEILVRNFRDYDILGHKEARLISAATSDRALQDVNIEHKDKVRMEIFKNMLTSLIVQDLA